MPTAFFINPRTNPEMRSLYQISLIPPQNHLEDYFLGVMATLSEYFLIGYSALILQDAKKDSLRVEALYGVGKESHPLSCFSRKGIIGEVLKSRQPMIIKNLNQEPLYEEMMKGSKQTDKILPPLLCIPLTVGNESIGVFNINPLYGSRDEFTEDFHFLSVLSALLSPSIKNYCSMGEETLARQRKTKLKSSLLEEILTERLAELLNRIDPYVESNNETGLLDDIINLVEKILIHSALQKVNGVQTAASQLLGINRNTLRKKMKELKIKFR